MMLESYKHAENSFLTLTYDEAHLPADGSLRPSDTQKWLKRFRKAIEPLKIRYYLVGEYGDVSWRPHYHAALFGVGPQFEPLVKSTWGKGHVMLAEFNTHTAQYICGYVTKKMTTKEDTRLNGKHPEFARMSLRPGIGATAIGDISELLFEHHGRQSVIDQNDVPRSLQHGGRSLPLGRYLRKKLRDEIGMPESWSQANLYNYSQEMSDLFKIAQTDAKYTPEEKLTVKSILLRKNLQKTRNLEAKTKIHEKGKTL